MSKMGWGLVSLAFGVAVTLSQPEGVVYPMVAWGAVTVGVLLIAAAWLRRRRRVRVSGQRYVASARLRRELRRVGNAILDFVSERESEAPSGMQPARTYGRRTVETAREERIRLEFEADSLSIYREEFAGDVRRLLHLLLGRRIGRNEARILLSPQSLEDLTALGWRLVELGSPRPQRRVRTAA